MTFQDKLDQLNATIEAEAASLGLIFVDGPGPEDVSLVPPDTITTNGQPRGVYQFAVAEAPERV
jgi:hypothetical protein